MTLIVFSEVGALSAEVEFSGERQVFPFNSWPLPGLTRQLAAIFANAVASDGWETSLPAAKSLYYSARKLVNHIQATDPDPTAVRVGSLTPEHLDAFDSTLNELYPESDSGAATLRWVVRMLREADLRSTDERDDQADTEEPVPSLASIRLLPDTRQRVRWVSRFDPPARTPLDAFSAEVTQRLRDSADKDIDEVVRRLTVDRARVIAEGHPPDPARSGKDFRREDVAWLIDSEGPLSQSAFRSRFGRREHIKVSQLNNLVFPSERDLLPFLIRLGLDTGIPVECLKILPSDCLRNPDKGRVTIRYLKRRGGKQRWKSKVVRDGHPMSPGGLIRTVQTLTRRAREITGSQRLWVGLLGPSTLRELPFDNSIRGSIRRYAKEHDLRDGEIDPDEGMPPLMRLDLRRLRKTHKVERIRATRGRVRDWADDHSVRVAVNHYGNVPELRGEHEAAIEAALTEALAVSPLNPAPAEHAGPDPDEGDEQQDDAQAAHVDPTATSVPGVDLWVATCRDPYDSPHGRKGKLCPVAFFGCLRCDNATIHLGKLPGIIQYLNHLVSQRERMSAEDWAAVHRDSHNRIVAHILPLFSATDIAKARAVAESPQRLVFLPPDLSNVEVA